MNIVECPKFWFLCATSVFSMSLWLISRNFHYKQRAQGAQ
jgi:hypothetical protein